MELSTVLWSSSLCHHSDLEVVVGALDGSLKLSNLVEIVSIDYFILEYGMLST